MPCIHTHGKITDSWKNSDIDYRVRVDSFWAGFASLWHNVKNNGLIQGLTQRHKQVYDITS